MFRIPGQPEPPSAGGTGGTFDPGMSIPQAAQPQSVLQRVFGALAGAGRPMQQPQAGAPPERSALNQLLITLGDFGAGVNGAAGPSQLLAQRAAQQEQARQAQFARDLELRDVLRKQVAEAPLEQQEAAKTRAKAVFSQAAPRGLAPDDATARDQLLDLGDLTIGPESLADLRQDPVGAQVRTYAQYNELQKDEQYQARRTDRADRKLLPGIVEKVRRGIIESKDPDLIAARDAAVKSDGALTAEEIVSLSEQYGTNVWKLTPEEAAALPRQSGAVSESGAIPGFRGSTEDVKKRREAEEDAALKLKTQKELELYKAGLRERLLKLKAESTPEKQGFGAKARDQAFGRNVYTPLIAEGKLAENERAIGELAGVIQEFKGAVDEKTKKSSGSLSGPIVGNVPYRTVVAPKAVNVEDRIGRIVQRDLRVVLGGQFAKEEGENLLRRSYNPSLEEADNLPRLENLYKEMSSRYQQTKAALAYFESHNGTLDGYTGATDMLGNRPSGDAPPGGAAKGKPTQQDVDRIAAEMKTDDVSKIKAQLRTEGYEVP